MVLISPKIYFKNTISKKIEVFKPNRRKKVGMYHCGPTVYSRAHIGNLSAYIFADVLRRLFEAQGYDVNQVVNITDVGHLVGDGDVGDDKMENQAKATGKKVSNIAEENTKMFLGDLDLLNIRTAKITFPKATDHIAEQISMIQQIEKNGYTYTVTDGVYFDTKKFPEYGMLGGINLDGLKAGARVEENQEKKNPTDFALWKFSKPGDNRQQEWESPWGIGFPGWHIECSAMSRKYLGENFDIHTGGIEHIPTHHNNEIAQSFASDHKILANYWLHINHLLLNGEKISKSVGNVVYLSDLQDKQIDPVIFRYWYLTSHYASEANFSWETITGAKKAFDKIITLIQTEPLKLGCAITGDKVIPENIAKVHKKYYQQALKELNHDVGTPEAIAIMWKLIKDDGVDNDQKVATILQIDQILGIGFGRFALQNLSNTGAQSKVEAPAEVLELVKKRQEARKNRDFELADSLRDEIRDAGYEVMDKGDDSELKVISN